MRQSHRVVPFEVKSAGDGADGSFCSFEGLASPYFVLDWHGDIVDPGAFTKDMGYMLVEGKIRDEHGDTTGRITGGEETSAGLKIKGDVLPTTAGKDQAILLKGKAITRLSIGYAALAKTYLEGADAIQAYWQSKGYSPTDDDLMMVGRFGYARLLTRVKVYEVSTTWLPANDAAVIHSVKGSGPRAGLTLDDEANQALAAVADLIERAESVKGLREAKGRDLSIDARTQLKALSQRLADLAVPREETPPAAETTALQEMARFQHTLSTLS